MSENKINRIKEYCKENIKENKKDKLQVIVMIKISASFFVLKTKGSDTFAKRGAYRTNRKIKYQNS